MDVTRREFIGCTAAGIAAATVLPHEISAAPPREGVTWIYGDPYLASVHEGGLGGATFDAARQRAMRFRTPAAARDAYVLGLEFRHA